MWPIISNLDAAAAAKLLQLFPTLCDPTDGRPPGSTVPGILQARTLKWVTLTLDPYKLKPLTNLGTLQQGAKERAIAQGTELPAEMLKEGFH